MAETRTSMPIMGCKAIPAIRWSAIAPHEAQAIRNHGQTLERLAQRGGLGTSEAVDIMEGNKWATTQPGPDADRRLLELCEPAAPLAWGHNKSPLWDGSP